MTNKLEIKGQKAVQAKYELQRMSIEKKHSTLLNVCKYLLQEKEAILAANLTDIENGKKNGMSKGLLDRLQITEDRLVEMVEGLKQIIELPDYIGEVMERFKLPSGVIAEKKRVPLGVIGIIYESRPNVTVDAFGLCFKTGNAVILKGGSDAIHSNIAIVKCIREALVASDVCEDAIQLIEDVDRNVTLEFMKMKQYVDVLIPRGGAGLIRSVVENSLISVIETGTGNNHVYVDKDADLDMAVKIVMNAKMQRVSVCNTCESLVVHSSVSDCFLPRLAEQLQGRVELRGDEKTVQILADCIPAQEEDFGKEYLDYIMSVKTVDSVEEAIAHINKYNTKHSECIVTENVNVAEKFLNEVDAACVYVNASTRFTDGFEFGFGAEIGISTQKLHARGPMGLKELTSHKYVLRGNGQIR